MRILAEYNGRRVDIKDPVSNRAGRPDNPDDLHSMINQALAVLDIEPPRHPKGQKATILETIRAERAK